MIRFIGLLLFGLSVHGALAQQLISGRVLAQRTNAPLSRVSVQVTGQPSGTTTDDAGRFVLQLPLPAASTTLTFSHLGYQALTVPAAQLGADVVLPEQSYLIGEVQVSYAQVRQLLLRRWKLDSACVAALTRVDVDQMCVLNPSQLSRREELYHLLFETIMGQCREYRDNGVVKTWGGIRGTNSRLRWQFDEATRTINVEAGEGTQPTAVLELTATRLVVRRADGLVYTWVPAAK